METPLLPDRPASRRFRRRVFLSLAALSVLSCVAVIIRTSSTSPFELENVATPIQPVDSFVNWLPESMRVMINSSVDPCNDFHAFACGGFDATTEIPKSKSSFAYSWDGDAKTITDELQAMMTADKGKVGDYYSACMNTELVEQRGLTPTQPWFTLIDAIDSVETMAVVMAKMHLAEVGNFFDWFISTDDQQPDRDLLYLDSGGLDLPDSSYFTDNTTRNIQHITVYRSYLHQLYALYGVDPETSEAIATDTLSIETYLASHVADDNSITAAVRHNLTSLEQSYPNFAWTAYFAAMDHSDIAQTYNQIAVSAPGWLKAMDDLFASRTLIQLKHYLRSHFMFNVSPLLTKNFFAINLIMDSDLYGVTEHPARQEKCVGATKAALPFLVSKMFVDKYFPPAAKLVATQMLENIRDSFREDLLQVPWMSEESRKLALDKLAKIFFEVGYPEVWPQYGFDVSSTDYFENSLQSSTWRSTRKYERLRHPVMRHRWTMSPATVNAYYDNGVNGVFVPAGLLQSPFFDDKMPLAHNYGSSGAIMAHELTHGFDNSGRKYDADCRKRQWWDDSTVSAFKQRAECLAEVYDQYKIAGSHVHGNSTLGENIADIGGLKTTHRAYLEQEAKATPGGADLNHRQMFWTSFAQTWCSVDRERVLKLNLLTDVHSPDKFRILGPLQENEDFAKDFSCPVGSAMNPASRCDLW